MSTGPAEITIKWLDHITREYYFRADHHQGIAVNLGMMAVRESDPTILIFPIEEGDIQTGLKVQVMGAGGFVTGAGCPREAQILSTIENGLAADSLEKAKLWPSI